KGAPQREPTMLEGPVTPGQPFLPGARPPGSADPWRGHGPRVNLDSQAPDLGRRMSGRPISGAGVELAVALGPQVVAVAVGRPQAVDPRIQGRPRGRRRLQFTGVTEGRGPAHR